MFNKICIVLALFVAVMANSVVYAENGSGEVKIMTEEELFASKSYTYVDQIRKGYFDGLYDDFSDEIKGLMSKEELATIVENALAEAGTFVKYGSYEYVDKDGFKVVVVSVEYSKQVLSFIFAYDEKQVVTGFRYQVVKQIGDIVVEKEKNDNSPFERLLVDKSLQYTEQIYGANFDGLYNDFSDEVKGLIGKKELVAVMENAFSTAGTFNKILGQEYFEQGGLKIVSVTVEHSRQVLVLTFVYDVNNAVSGFHYKIAKQINNTVQIDEKDYDKEPLVKRSLAYLEQLHNAKTDVFYDDMAEVARNKVSKEHFAEIWQGVLDKSGFWENLVSVGVERDVNATSVIVVEKYANNLVVTVFMYNKQGKVVAFSFQAVDEVQ